MSNHIIKMMMCWAGLGVASFGLGLLVYIIGIFAEAFKGSCVPDVLTKFTHGVVYFLFSWLMWFGGISVSLGLTLAFITWLLSLFF